MKAIIAALDATPRVDEIGVFWLASSGFLFGDRTWLEPIRVADAAMLMTVSERGVSSHRYFRPRFCARPPATSLDDFVDGFATALERAAARLTQGSERVGILLSGGLDSRSALLALSRGRQLSAAWTFGDAQSRDLHAAQQLAAIAGVPHMHLRYQPGYLNRVLAPIVWRTEGLVPFAATQYTSLHFHSELGARSDVLVFGHCGDTLTGRNFRPNLFLARSKRQFIEQMSHHIQACPTEMLARIFNPRFYQHAASAALDALPDTVADIDQEHLSDVAGVWGLEHHQRRSAFHSAALDRYRFEVRTPFLDNDLVDHLLQAPPQWRFQQFAYKRMIVTAFPEAAHVPWAYTGHPIRSTQAGDLIDAGWNFARERVRRGWARATSADALGSGADFRNLAMDLRAATDVATVIRNFVVSPYFPSDVFDRPGIEEIVHRHWERRENHAHLVTILATFATAWRFFVAERPTAMPAAAQPPAWRAD